MVKIKKYAIGLMSGTSLDGVDASLIEIEGVYTKTQVQFVNSIYQPYDDEVREMLFKLSHPNTATLDRICQMNVFLGKFYADVVNKLIDNTSVPKEKIIFVSSHGQTIYHIPEGTGVQDWDTASTLQIGDISVLSEQTDMLVVGDFRVADIAAGGQGAPLTSYVDYILFRDENKTRALQNIGGIGNVTIIPSRAQPQDVISFDTGPGNMVIDAIVSEITDGKQKYDHNGMMAGQGKVVNSLLNDLMKHPYILRSPPKTTGREQFGHDFVKDLLSKARKQNINDIDLLTTVTCWTASTIADSYKRLESEYNHKIEEVILSGGGSYNDTLIKYLQAYLPEMKVMTSNDAGMDSDQKEAIAFAVLGHECLNGMFNTLPSATGSNRPVIMGKISFTQIEAYQKLLKVLGENQPLKG